MDRKSLVFLILLTAAFLFFNNYFFPPREVPPNVAPSPQEEKLKSQPSSSQGSLYVIENAYQQLVFSSLGGALAEVNLPLKSKERPQSVVRPIAVDRILAEKYPEIDRFPSGSYRTFETSFSEGVVGGYYPLLRRGIDPNLYGLSVVSDRRGTPIEFSLKKLDKDSIQFSGKAGGRSVTKTISFPEDAAKAPYTFDVSIELGDGQEPVWLSSGVPEVELISGSPAPSLKYRETQGKKIKVDQIDLPKASVAYGSVHPDWICNSNGFLGMIIDPVTNPGDGFTANFVPGKEAPTRLSYIDTQYDLYPVDKYPGYEMLYPLTDKTTTFRVYAGPFAKSVLAQVDAAYTNPATGYNPDFVSSISFHGWFSFISEPFAKLLFFLMDIFHAVTRSWGIAIILLTVALRLMLYPLNAWSIQSTLKMQKIAPKVAALQERYKKDPKQAQMEIMALYKQNGVNPLGGCLPLLIQMPFLIGMFDLLKSSFELRGASFIPGWIDNLTAPDVVFSWGYPIWFIGTSFHLLPILLAVVMYLQQKFSSVTPKDPSQMTDQQKQQKFMGNLMVVVFTVLFYNFPSGLNLYWLSSMLLGILQQWWMTKRKAA